MPTPPRSGRSTRARARARRRPARGAVGEPDASAAARASPASVRAADAVADARVRRPTACRARGRGGPAYRRHGADVEHAFGPRHRASSIRRGRTTRSPSARSGEAGAVDADGLRGRRAPARRARSRPRGRRARTARTPTTEHDDRDTARGRPRRGRAIASSAHVVISDAHVPERELAQRGDEPERDVGDRARSSAVTCAARRLSKSRSRRATPLGFAADPARPTAPRSATPRYQRQCRSRTVVALGLGRAGRAPNSRRVSSSRYARDVGVDELHHRLVDQVREQRRDLRRREVVDGAHVLGRVEVEAAGEQAEAARTAGARRASSRSWDHATRSRRVRWLGCVDVARAGRAARSVGRGARASAAGLMARSRAAASSIASGMPSRPRTISPTASTLSAVEREPGPRGDAHARRTARPRRRRPRRPRRHRPARRRAARPATRARPASPSG